MLNNAFSNFLLTRKNISYLRETKLEGKEKLLNTLTQRHSVLRRGSQIRLSFWADLNTNSPKLFAQKLGSCV